ncbi:hypothetical protein DYB26_001724 [Aphanomyces astaci]|uniref:Uncharacterized protein n=1 Tax=Aphanomyces astaci TaxID=112090 RepID=A0A397FUA7_APHAT|nr:hypothetical protein DYB26_001724 [Aphanomyces astaci]RHZ40635.1 hypothetical protein DYB31_002578 [Aphanomyces astaci]
MGCIESKFKYEERQVNAVAAFVHNAIDGKVALLAKAIRIDRKKVVAVDRFGMTALHWAIPEEAEPDLGQVLQWPALQSVEVMTAVVPFDDTLSRPSTTDQLQLSPSDQLATLSGYALLGAIFTLHDLALARDPSAMAQFDQLVATHCVVGS